MNYRPSLIGSFEIGNGEGNFAYKGIALRLDSGAGGIARGKAWMMFGHDTLRVAAAWSGKGFIDWNGVNFNAARVRDRTDVGQSALRRHCVYGCH